MKDRRRVKRVIITCVAEVTSLYDHQDLEGYVTNISRKGLGMMARKQLARDAEVVVKLSFFGVDGIKEVENIKGRVNRVHSLANVYSIGIQFEQLSEKENPKLLSYIDAAEKSL